MESVEQTAGTKQRQRFHSNASSNLTALRHLLMLPPQVDKWHARDRLADRIHELDG